MFFGDSITDNWSKPEYGGFFPGMRYVNRGIGGQTTAQMLLRFRADVLELDPLAVVILAGTNDIAGNSGPVTLDQVQDSLTSMAELARAHGIKVVLASLLPVSDDKQDANGQPITRTRQRPTQTIRELNRWLATYAAPQRPRLPRLLQGDRRRERPAASRAERRRAAPERQGLRRDGASRGESDRRGAADRRAEARLAPRGWRFAERLDDPARRASHLDAVLELRAEPNLARRPARPVSR